MRVPGILRLSARLFIFIVFAGVMLMIDSAETAAQESVTLDSAQEAAKLIETRQNDPDFVILDVRTKEEYDAGHIAGAILVPNETIVDKQPELLPDLDAEILVYCRSGNRSAQAARKLIAIGYTNVVDFGGIIDWPYGSVTD